MRRILNANAVYKQVWSLIWWCDFETGRRRRHCLNAKLLDSPNKIEMVTLLSRVLERCIEMIVLSQRTSNCKLRNRLANTTPRDRSNFKKNVSVICKIMYAICHGILTVSSPRFVGAHESSSMFLRRLGAAEQTSSAWSMGPETLFRLYFTVIFR